ncbi:MAG TPA: SusD/RagB family nutrient-binding outer membrane lipoprotein [Chitinophagaceae bacterium]|nr:SusD/RagB family nutrient-binding outer membrane lipoprotein [Chitinophagaceae bacterium]
MKKNISIIVIGVIAGFVFVSCKKELQSVNNNPNNLEKADPTTLLSNTIVTEFYNNSNLAWTLGNGLSQQATFSQSYYNQSARFSPVTNEPYWIPMYQSARDANTLYGIGQAQGNTLLQAVALTLRSYAFAQLTELWGDIPFREALQGANGIYTPKYDAQQVVYTDPSTGILPSLKRADSILKANPNGLVNGDMLFNSSVASWRRFINALRLRYLLRISSKMDVSAEMQSIVTDGAIMQNASQSASLALPTTTPYNFVSLTERAGDFAVKYMSSILYNVFVTTADTARITTYFTISSNTASGAPFSFNNYGGMPLVVDATSTQANASSNFNSSFTNGSNKNLLKARVMTYAEQEFILAEAALKGYIPGSAATFYNNGVLGAYAEIGIDANTANNYLNHSAVAFDNSSMSASMNQIITQKWVANINNGFEGWIEYKRTGIPALDPGAGSVNLNGGKISYRFLYPTTEKSINSTNYNEEIQKMGGTENTIYKAWW